MDTSFIAFWEQVTTNPMLMVSVILTLAVIFVNGWTDAPNAIATCVTTRCMEAKPAILMAAAFNFIGVLVMTLINSSVAMTIKDMVNFNGNNQSALVALCAALVAIVVWAVAAWYFGIPPARATPSSRDSPEQPSLFRAACPASTAGEWIKVIYGLILSAAPGICPGLRGLQSSHFHLPRV